MSIDKSRWQRVNFGDVVRLNTDRVADPAAVGIERYVGLEHIDPADLRILRWGLVEEGTTFTNHFRPGQVLFGKRRAYQRKIAVAKFEGVCSGDIYVLEPKNDRLLPELLPFLCQTEAFYQHAVGTSAGSLSPRTNWEQLSGFEFLLPPLEEQLRVAETMTAARGALESCQALLESCQAFDRSVLDAIVLRWDEAARSVPLGSILRGSPESGCSAPPRDGPTGHWVLALSALTSQGYKEQELKPVDKTNEMLSAILRSGDLLISRSNTVDRVGYAGIYTGELAGRVSFPDTMMRINVDNDLVSNEFLELVLQSTTMRRRIMSIAAGTSASMKKINRRNLLQIQVPLPSRSEQECAIDMRQQLRRSEARIRRRLALIVDVYTRFLGRLIEPGHL